MSVILLHVTAITIEAGLFFLKVCKRAQQVEGKTYLSPPTAF